MAAIRGPYCTGPSAPCGGGGLSSTWLDGGLDEFPLGVQQQVKQQVTPRPATTAGRLRQLIVTQLLHVIGDGLVGRHHGHASTAGLDMAHPATIDDPSPGLAGL